MNEVDSPEMVRVRWWCPGKWCGTEAANSTVDSYPFAPRFKPYWESRMKFSSLKFSLVAAAVAFTALPTVALADVAYNVGAFSDYRYRGISQTRLKPAFQAGVDWSDGPFYVGAWASTIRWVKDAGGESNFELDLYGGYKGEIAKDFTYDVGFLTYQYPSNKLNPKAETYEIYGAVTYGPATVKYSRSVSNLFGFTNSKGSGYLEVAATFEVGAGISLTPHVGRQSVAKNGAASYTEASLTASKDIAKGLSLSLMAVDARTGAYFGPNGKDLGKRSLVLGLKSTF
jgi:uncharacterized protein (TIGR02001 family)